MASLFPRGSEWRRWDLHFHTPSSFDYDDKGTTNQQIVDGLIAAGIRVVAITDHHTMDVPRIRDLQERGRDRLTVLPGIELRDDHGAEPIHYICIFPEDSDLDHIWTTLQGRLGLTSVGIQEKGGDEKVYVPIELGSQAARELGGVVSIHAGAKTNSIEGISNREQFQQRIKYDITKQFVDILEIGQLRDIERHHNIIFPATGLDKPLVICSDSHRITTYSTAAPFWIRADPTFRGLLMAIREPRDRVFIGAMPDQLVRVQQNKTKYVKSISFSRGPSAPPSEQWFSGTIEFNPGLVAIVGNKGSGKSALADTLGLLGSTRNAPFFAFLSRDRFRHPISGRAEHFFARLIWESGDSAERSLAESVKPEEVERIKYVPQDHIERICNELIGPGADGFESELRSVIFSHVPEHARLAQNTLDDLVRLQTEEKQKRIDSLLKQLRDESRHRAALEDRADPTVRKEIEERIARRELELNTHDASRPGPVPDPATIDGSAAVDPAVLATMSDLQAQKDTVSEAIASTTDALKLATQRQAAATRLVEKLENFKKDFDAFHASLASEAQELGLDPHSLVSLSLDLGQVEAIRVDAAKARTEAIKRLDDPNGLRSEHTELEAKLAQLQNQLDAPNRAYQAYLMSLDEWTKKRESIVGSPDEPDSLNGLKASLQALDELPAAIQASREKQVALALEIHAEKVAQVDVFREFYKPVQNFIDSHAVANDRLKLEFRAELVNEGFADRLLALLAQNRRGSFMGIDEGRALAESIVEAVVWEDPQSVREFLLKIDETLHVDMRPASSGQKIPLKEQLLRGRRVDELFEVLYGLEYLRPRYVLRWEGKDLSMLSPGERGTLLLVFYLLIDKEDIPLIIDQPEGNLDNFTVAKILVECIKETRKRRQVFIVTHNPNLAVVCDADQIVHASMDKQDGNRSRIHAVHSRIQPCVSS